MKKIIYVLVFTLFVFGCSKDEPLQPKNETENNGISINKKNEAIISFEIPKNKKNKDFELRDNKGRIIPFNNNKNIKVEDKTIVYLTEKSTSKIIYIGYAQKENSTKVGGRSTLVAARGKNNCQINNVINARSSAIFLLSVAIRPQTVGYFGTSSNKTLQETYKSNIICSTFSNEEITKVENSLKSLIDDGKDLLSAFASKAIGEVVKPITAGLFSDCWDVLGDLMVKQKIEYEEHPQSEKESSLAEFNDNDYSTPSVEYDYTEFNRYSPTGIIIKKAIKKDGGKWEITFDAYNSLPIPFAIKVGKLNNSIPTPNGKTNYIVHSNGLSGIKLLKQGINCKGFINNISDSYYAISSEGTALRSNTFDKTEVTLEFDPENQYVIFEGPNKNTRVRAFQVLEMLSGVLDLIFDAKETADSIKKSENKEDKKDKNEIILEIVNEILKNNEALNILSTENFDFQRALEITRDIVKEYVKESFDGKNLVSNKLKKYYSKKGIGSSTAASKLEIFELGLNTIDYVNKIKAFRNSDIYANKVPAYKIYIPGSKQIKPILSTPKNNDKEVNINNVTFNFKIPKEVKNKQHDITYELLLSKNGQPFKSVSKKTTNSFKLEKLDLNTQYKWKILANIKANKQGYPSFTNPIYSDVFTFKTSTKTTKDNLFYLHKNGITIMAYDHAKIGDTSILNGITYTLVDEATLRNMVKENKDVTKVVTSRITNMETMFRGAYKFNQDIGAWDVSNVTNMKRMFIGVSKFNQNIGAWDVSNVTDMKEMFDQATEFNQDIGAWNVSKVINMGGMFGNASAFNQDISTWDVSNVTDMNRMFGGAGAFNQNIGVWNVSKVTNMYGMFNPAKAFNQDISTWDVSNVTDMGRMFAFAKLFNQNIGAWNVSNVTNMKEMFENAPAFNQNIGAWDVSNVTDMGKMFENASAFNQNISTWNVSNVTNMHSMFNNAKAFNQNIGTWNVSNVTNMHSMFNNASAFNQNISTWNVSNVTNMAGMFFNAKTFNQNIGTWNVSNVTDMFFMFGRAQAFNQNISAWNVGNVISMHGMFARAQAFNQNISAWNVSKVKDCSRFGEGTNNWTQPKPNFKNCNPN